jgi:hypothetical protein
MSNELIEKFKARTMDKNNWIVNLFWKLVAITCVGITIYALATSSIRISISFIFAALVFLIVFHLLNRFHTRYVTKNIKGFDQSAEIKSVNDKSLFAAFVSSIKKKPGILLIVLVFLVLATDVVYMRNSDNFEKGKLYVEKNSEIKSVIGQVEGYGYNITDKQDKEDPKLRYMSFKVHGSLGSKTIEITFQKSESDWFPIRHRILQ